MYDVSRSIDVLDGVSSDYFDARNPNLLDRWQPMADWLALRLASGVDPHCKVSATRIGPRIRAFDRAGKRLNGVNLASQDYLGLSSHPHVIAAATDAVLQYGVHSGGPAASAGLTALATELEARIARFLGVGDATMFPTGRNAAHDAIRTLARAGDHILIDSHAGVGLHEAAAAATTRVHRIEHCSADAFERRLFRLKKNDPGAGILIVTESTFGLDGDAPDLAALQALAWEFGATLLVDAAHDLGALGPTGKGEMELQGMLGKIDVLTGCLSRVFATSGGFVASSHPALKLALRLGADVSVDCNAISPVQAAAALAAFDIVESVEGAYRRDRLFANAVRLRDGLIAEGFEVIGRPGPAVAARLGGSALARRLTAAVLSAGGIVNLVEEPVVAKNDCRWQLLAMADHSANDIDEFVAIAAVARAAWVAPGSAYRL